MYIDVISYQLAEGFTEGDLKNAANDILEVWMKKQQGFLGWDINKNNDGYTDFVFWKDKASADKATVNMKDIPKDHIWTICYNMQTVKSKNLNSIFSFRQ
jgi:hypothetical protein